MNETEKDETQDVYFAGTETVKIAIGKKLLSRAIIRRVDLDKLITVCLECILGEPGAATSILINPGQYAAQIINDTDGIEILRLTLMDGREVDRLETEYHSPDLPFYQ